MNMNDFAVWLTKQEGLKESVSVAQVKEILRLVARKVQEDPVIKNKFEIYGNKLNNAKK